MRTYHFSCPVIWNPSRVLPISLARSEVELPPRIWLILLLCCTYMGLAHATGMPGTLELTPHTEALPMVSIRGHLKARGGSEAREERWMTAQRGLIKACRSREQGRV